MADMPAVACIGTGVIGSSWAAGYAMKGCQVRLYDLSDALLADAAERISVILGSLKQDGVLSDEQIARTKDRLYYTTSLEDAVKDVYLVQENVPDRIELKQRVLAQIEDACPSDAIIASSTSYLLISDISKQAERPERCIGAHPYNPPHLLPLVEITKNPRTSEETVWKAAAFYKSCGKAPVVLNKDSMGFLCNRLQLALYRECADLVMRGVCSVEDIDTAVTFGLGLRWAALGPNMIFQLGGGDGGLKGLLTNLKEGGDKVFADLASWTEMPPEWLDIGQSGVETELEHSGRTAAETAEFRDKVLVELLKLHQKM